MVKTLPWMLCEKLGYNDRPVKIIQAWTCIVTVEMEILEFMLVLKPGWMRSKETERRQRAIYS